MLAITNITCRYTHDGKYISRQVEGLSGESYEALLDELAAIIGCGFLKEMDLVNESRQIEFKKGEGSEKEASA